MNEYFQLKVSNVLAHEESIRAELGNLYFNNIDDPEIQVICELAVMKLDEIVLEAEEGNKA